MISLISIKAQEEEGETLSHLPHDERRKKEGGREGLADGEKGLQGLFIKSFEKRGKDRRFRKGVLYSCNPLLEKRR